MHQPWPNASLGNIWLLNVENCWENSWGVQHTRTDQLPQKVTLYSYHLSSCSWRVQLALLFKGMFGKTWWVVITFPFPKIQHLILSKSGNCTQGWRTHHFLYAKMYFRQCQNEDHFDFFHWVVMCRHPLWVQGCWSLKRRAIYWWWDCRSLSF